MYRSKFAILASTALSLGAVQTASAQNAISWTGFYVGANVGYSWGNADTAESIVAPWATSIGGSGFPFPGGTAVTDALNPSGVIAGGQFGYNWQFAPGWLAGFETDFQWSGQKDSGSGSFNGQFNFPCGATTCIFSDTLDVTAKLTWFGTARGRVGTLWNGMLFYGTGGLAYGHVTVSGTNTLYLEQQSSGANVTYVTPFSYSKTKLGWVLGAGIEGAVGMSNWTWKIEYLHIDLGSIGGGNIGSTPNFTFASFNFTDEIIRLGINYRFGAAQSP